MQNNSLVELIKSFDEFKDKYPTDTFPQKDVIYTVRGVVKSNTSKLVGILLEEIVNTSKKYRVDGKIITGELTFLIEHFRELQPPVDISDVLEMLQSEQLAMY